MTPRYMLAALAVGLSLAVNSFAETPSDVSRSRVATLEVRCDETRPEVRRTIKVYPADEVYLGDTVYIFHEEENRSERAIPDWSTGFFSVCGSIGTFASQGISESYRAVAEDETQLQIDRLGEFRDFLPGEKRAMAYRFFELAPLEDWNAPFWKELREKLRDNPDGVVCKLGVNNTYRDKNKKIRFETLEVEILVKPRPNDETERLQRWFDATPSKLFPVVEGVLPPGAPYDPRRKVPRQEWLKSSGQSDIEIGGKSYDPWLFVRKGFRKPSDPNAPTTVDGWRRIEAEFAPSTLRDEITLTRLQLEYYDADEGAASDAALKTLVDWTSQLPEPQRAVLSQSLRSKSGKFRNTPLQEKNAPLGVALLPGPQNRSSGSLSLPTTFNAFFPKSQLICPLVIK